MVEKYTKNSIYSKKLNADDFNITLKSHHVSRYLYYVHLKGVVLTSGWPRSKYSIFLSIVIAISRETVLIIKCKELYDVFKSFNTNKKILNNKY